MKVIGDLRHNWPALLLLGLLVLVYSWAWAGDEGVPTGPVHVAVLLSKDIAPYDDGRQGLESQLYYALGDRLKALHIIHLHRWRGREEELSRWMVTQDIELTFCFGKPALELAMGALKKRPILFGFILDSDLPARLPPNVAGIYLNAPLERRVELLRRMTGGRRFGLVARPTPRWREILRSLPSSDQVIPVWIHGTKELPKALETLASRGIEGFLMVPDPTIFGTIPSIDFTILWGLRHRIPVMGLSKGYVKRGALCALEPDYNDMGRQLGELGLRLLERPDRKGTLIYPAELKLSINFTTLRRLGLTLPPELMEGVESIF